MQKITVVTGTGVPLRRSDVDTDQIIPSDYLRKIERTGFDEGLFGEWRESSDFVLNQERYANASILVAGPNFGTGSSREHAVWALQQYGFVAVLSSRFADIFRNNSTKTGLLTITIPQPIIETIWDALEDNPGTEIVVDVEARRVAIPALGIDEAFPLDDFTQYRFLNGLDDIGLTLRHDADITVFEATRSAWLPEAAI